MSTRRCWRCRRGPAERTKQVTGVMNGWTMGIDAWLWMGAWMLVLVVAVVLLVWAPRRGRDLDEPIDVLRGRLARGEITPEEFERARGLLATGPTTEGKAHR